MHVCIHDYKCIHAYDVHMMAYVYHINHTYVSYIEIHIAFISIVIF